VIIRTVLGDITPEALGVCYGHEHVYGQPPAEYAQPDLMLLDEAGAVDELRAFYSAGGRALIEMTTPDYGRDAGALMRISRAAGVHIVGVTGYNKEKFSAHLLEKASIPALAQRFIIDVMMGMDGTDIRTGVIKASSTLNAISPLAEKLFRAAAQAHHITQAPISTHTEMGTMALEQVALLTGEGVPPERILIGHMDHRLELEHHLELAQTGVFIGYDQIGKTKYAPDEARADMIAAMVERGYANQIMLAGDTARLSGWAAHGGGGFTHILNMFVPLLRERGVTDAAIELMLVHNPARLLAFEPT
jgi:5-phospho-D-xylono-1,4-lactonase